MSKNITKTKRSLFEVNTEFFLASVQLDKTGKIVSVRYHFNLGGLFWNENRESTEEFFDYFVGKAFELIMYGDIQVFKDLIKNIKETEPVYYKKGIELMKK